jgi:hypothetical protein
MLDKNDHITAIDNKKAAAKSFMNSGMKLIKGNKLGAMKDAFQGVKHLMEAQKQQQMAGQGPQGEGLHGSRKNETRGLVIQWSGCKDNQTSADAHIVSFFFFFFFFFPISVMP